MEFNTSLTRSAPRPCWQCYHFGGMGEGNGTARCMHPDCSPVKGSPEDGCCSWVAWTANPAKLNERKPY